MAPQTWHHKQAGKAPTPCALGAGRAAERLEQEPPLKRPSAAAAERAPQGQMRDLPNVTNWCGDIFLGRSRCGVWQSLRLSPPGCLPFEGVTVWGQRWVLIRKFTVHVMFMRAPRAPGQRATCAPHISLQSHKGVACKTISCVACVDFCVVFF